MTVSTFTIGKLTIENNYPQIDIVENFYASAKERQTLYTIVAVSKGVYTFVGANDWDAFHNEVFINGTFASAQLAAEAAFDLAVETATELEAAFNATADAANQLLHIDIQNEVAEQDAAQAASEALAEANDIDFIQVYIDGKPNKDASIGVMHAASGKYIQYFLRDDLAVNTAVKLNSNVFYLEETILDTCFAHDNGEWEFWANPAYPQEKSLLMIYLCTQPIKARKKPRYPQQDDYFDYAYGGDGYTADEVLDI